ncbi:MAG: hypothetical protein LLG06_02745 [Desulfobacteraceae bacterium]|nr:hypothetical protein [Desulfobacteraceae bacterium]
MKKTLLAISMAVLMVAGSMELASAAGGPGRGNGQTGRNWSCPYATGTGQAVRGAGPGYQRGYGRGTGMGRHANPNCPYRTR